MWRDRYSGILLPFAVLAFGIVNAPARADETVKVFNIPAEDLGSALREFGRQSNQQILFSTQVVQGKATKGVKGSLDADAALAKLLVGTGLVVSKTPDESLLISQADAKGVSAPSDPPYAPLGASNDQNPNKSAPTQDNSGRLEDIIVTARRREENLQTVPIAITAVSQQTLQENNVQTLGDLQYLVPSMATHSLFVRDGVNVDIRGEGSSFTAGLPSVVAYLNEVPIPANLQGELAGGPGLFFDLENVQVLKGPQGTLFGQNSTGGAILLQTARPTNDFGGRIQVGYGNYNDREVDGAINIPIISDVLLTRFAFNGQVRDGFTHLLAEPGYPNGVYADNRDYWSIRGTVTFHPNDVFQNDTILTWGKYTSQGSPFILTDINPSGLVPTVFPSIATMYGQQQALGVRTVIPQSVHLDSNGSNLSLNNISRVGLGDGLTFRNIFGLDVANTTFASDLDGTALPILDSPVTPWDVPFRQFTEEAQLLGKSLGERLDWIAGAFFLDQPTLGFAAHNQTLFGAPANGIAKQGEKSKALFVQGTYDLSAVIRNLKVTAGARYTWDERSSDSASTEPPGPITDIEVKDGAPTWTGELSYQAAPQTLLYLSASRGYRTGGANGVNVEGTLLPNYGPEFVNNYEFGVKSDWELANIPIRTNAAVYYQNYSAIQVQSVVFIDNLPFGVEGNAAHARVTGTELETVMQLTKDLQVGATFDYLDFVYEEFGPGANAALLNADRTFTRPPRKYGLSARYRLPLDPQVGDLSVKANWNWQAQSASFLSSAADASRPSGQIQSFGLLNMVLDWNGIVGSRLDASLFASNLLNKVYSTGGASYYTSLGFAVQMFGEPRMYGIRLRYKFGAEGR